MSDFLFLIPARGGSKGLPRKNIKPLFGKPLIHYSIDIARQFTTDDCICVSTDDAEIKASVESIKLRVPFIRPLELATDEANSHDVVMHALDYYASKGRSFKGIVLLQPTSPLRLKKHLAEAMQLLSKDVDVVLGVKETKSNPHSVLVEKDSYGFLKKIMPESSITRRQDAPKVYEINGAVYIYNTDSLKKQNSFPLERKMPYIMPSENSADIDTLLDWQWTEFLLENKIVKLDY
jgi:CMP-N,N'-diacetyllegionaminic acid synthase